MENCSPLAGAGSCFSDFSGSSCGAGLAPWLANIFVKEPGSDCVACAPGLDSETGEGGVGAGDIGPAFIGAIPPPLENILVNSPGADCGATRGDGGVGVGDTGPAFIGAIPPELENILVNSPGADCAGAPGLDSETWEGGVGVGAIGVLMGGAAGSGEPLPPIELNICVNEPGPDDPEGAPGPAFGT